VYGNVYAGLKLPGAGINYHACIRHATSLLLAKGHRRIVLVAYDVRRAGEQDTVRGFREAFAAHRSEIAVPVVLERPDSDAVALCRQLDGVLRGPHRPTASSSAIPTTMPRWRRIFPCAAEDSRRRLADLPQRGSVLQFMRPTPAFYRASMELAARLLFNRVRHAIDGTCPAQRPTPPVPELVLGESIGPPPLGS
jgi:hypothetical protein